MAIEETAGLTFVLRAKDEASAAFDHVKVQATTAGKEGGDGFAKMQAPLMMVGAALAGGGIAALKMAGDFQESMTQLVTGAGESKDNIDMVKKGIMEMAPQVGMSADALAKGMFMIESAGYHGAEGLSVMKAAAQGAKVGNAELGTVADAVTSALNAYGLKAEDATKVTNELVTTVSSGKMHMEDLAGSLATVLPAAAAAGISLADVGGAIATMTSQGMSAKQATQDLANTIGALQKPLQPAQHEMTAMGLKANEVAMSLGKKGLTATLEELSQAVMAHMGPAGTVLQSTFNQSKSAAADAVTMMKQLPPSIQGAAQAFLDNSITAKEWKKDLSNLTPEQKNLAQEFATTAKNSTAFNSLLKSGSADAQTYNAAMSEMTGGATGLSTSLLLTGKHAETAAANVKAIGDAANSAGTDVIGFDETQKDFNFKVESLKASLGNLAITIGTDLMPVMEWLMSHLNIVIPVIGTVIGLFVAWKAAMVMGSMIGFVANIIQMGAAFVVMAAEEGIATAAGFAFGAAMEFALGPIGLIILGIMALIAIVYLVIRNWDSVSAFFMYLWEHIKDIFRAAIEFVTAHWKEFVAVLLIIMTGGLALIPLVIIKFWDQIKAVFAVAISFVTDNWRIFVAVLLVIMTGGLALIPLAVIKFWDQIKALFAAAYEAIKGALAAALDFIFGLIKQYIELWLTVFVQFPLRVIGALAGLGATVWGAISGPLHSLASNIGGIVDNIVGFFAAMPGRIVSFLVGIGGTVASSVGGAISAGFKSAVNGMIALINRTLAGMGDYGFDSHLGIPGFHVRDLFGGSMPSIPSLAVGGIIQPSSGGTIVRVAEAGQAEAIAPLATLSAMISQAISGGGGAGGDIVINLDGREIARVVSRHQGQAMRNQGAWMGSNS